MERESKNPPKATEEIHSLPEEIIGEILLRLPVQSLLRFRCVSKSWRSLIASKTFIKSHLEISTKNPNFTNHKIAFFDLHPPDRTLKQTSLHSLLNERAIIETSEVVDPVYTLNDSIDVLGCCNGLICIIFDRKHIFLWNPATRMHKKLPHVGEKVIPGYVSKYGFGFDESSDDYKVFVIVSLFLITGRDEAVGKIYSLKTNSWKLLTVKDADPFIESGKFVSGKIHWGARYGLDYDWGILFFDLRSEVYGVVEQPDYRAGEYNTSLGVLGGCLCVLSDYQQVCADIWVMKEHGVKESWEKVLTVPYPCDPEDGILSTPFCIGSKGEVLFVYGPNFIIYYPEEKLYRRPNSIEFGSDGEAHVYVESLVSLVS